MLAIFQADIILKIYVSRTKVFMRTAPNTFGLIELANNYWFKKGAEEDEISQL